MELVGAADVRRLLEQFAKKQKDGEKSSEEAQEKCCKLFQKDYPDSVFVNNQNGSITTSYPSIIIIPQATAGPPSAMTSEDNNHLRKTCHKVSSGESRGADEKENRSPPLEVSRLRELMVKARVARCRGRFPVPVIILGEKYICRSATLSGGPEIYGRSGFDLLFPASTILPEDESDPSDPYVNQSGASSDGHSSLPSISNLSLGDSSQVFSKVRSQDIKLLKGLGVKYICDLMVEKKKVKFGMNITSSEKADKEGRYNDFEILSLPYPGCEFFREYRDKEYTGEGLVFDWNQNYVDAVLDIPKDTGDVLADVTWTDYKSWDILKLTRNYLKLLLHLLSSPDSGSLLIHCISGWDRTPLFISLLRLTLWADGKIHQNLSPLEITYLTLAYDWYLFGHNLSDRLTKGEEILFFCFYFLKFIASDDFTLDPMSTSSSISSSSPSASSSSLLHPLNKSTPPLTSSPSSSTTQKNSCGDHKSTPYTNGCCHHSLDHSALFADDALEGIEEPRVTPARYYLGSCTSLNSNCSSSSIRSQSESTAAGAQTTFALNGGVEESFCCVRSPSTSSYPPTPPTLTNSEEGNSFLMTDAVDFGTCVASCSPVARKKVSSPNCSLDTVEESACLNPSKTTPVPIPGQTQSDALRKLSNGGDAEGWQMVSETGSIKDNLSSRAFSYSSPESQDSGSMSGRKSNGSHHPLSSPGINSSSSARGSSNDIKKSLSFCSQQRMIRREKLQSVRNIFYNAYSSVIGFRFKNGSSEVQSSSTSSGLSLLYQHLGVGIYSGRLTAPH